MKRLEDDFTRREGKKTLGMCDKHAWRRWKWEHLEVGVASGVPFSLASVHHISSAQQSLT